MQLSKSLQQLAVERIVHTLSEFGWLTPTSLAMVHNYIRILNTNKLTKIIIDTDNLKILEVEGVRKLSKDNTSMAAAVEYGHIDIVRLIQEHQNE